MSPQEILSYAIGSLVLWALIEYVAYGYSRKIDRASTQALLDAEQAAHERYQRTARRQRTPE